MAATATSGWRTATAKAGCTVTPKTANTWAASTERRAASAGSTPRTGYWWTTEKPTPELYIADRANNRVMVYDLEGNFKRSVRRRLANHAVHIRGGRGPVGDPRTPGARHVWWTLTIIWRANWGTIHRRGPTRRVAQRPRTRRQPRCGRTTSNPAEFNSPHGIAADAEGNLYVPEWLIGGRFTKLVRN